MKFLSPEVALYLCKSTTLPCMEYCCHVCAGALSFYLGILDKLQKRIRMTNGPSLAGSLEPSVVKIQPVFSLGIVLIDVHLNWLNWFHFLILERGVLIILIEWMILLSSFLDVISNSMSTVFFSRTARPQNFSPTECFPLRHDLNCFRCLLFIDSFLFNLAWRESQLKNKKNDVSFSGQ